MALAPLAEAVDLIEEAGGETLSSCYQCGLCTSTCPWNIVKSFPVRRMIHQAQLGLADLGDERWWLCVTCQACVGRCPQGVRIIDIIKALRRIMVEAGNAPRSLKAAMAGIASLGNPWQEAPEKRADWAQGLEVKTFVRGTELLYFPCCTPAYEPKARRIARATASILSKAGADFGILGPLENCCGESVRKAGNEGLFRELAERNISAFQEHGVSRIVVSSPHCFHTFKNEYPELGGDFEVIHFTQYLAGLIEEGRLKFTKELNKRVTYHDPCYLGRHNGIYDEPRDVLRHIPGLELVEMPNFGADSLCCGGGGGGIWMETRKGERLSELRIEQAIEVGAEVLATSCPYCILNFDDSAADRGDIIEVKDISELVIEVI